MSLIINGKTIDEDVLYAEFSNIKGYFESLGNVSCCERDEEFRGYAKRNIIARVLLADEAERLAPLPPDAEIDSAIEQMKQEQGEFQFAAMVATHPDQMEGLRREVTMNLRVQTYLAELVKDVPEPTEAELRAYYDSHLDLFMTAAEVRASHISKNPGRGESRREVYDLMCDIRRQLLAGGDFDALAREHSDKGKEQIDLGFFKQGEYPEEFETVAFSMDVGELSPVFSSTYGYHIAKVTDRRPAAALPFDDVLDQVKQQVVSERQKLKTQGVVEELKARSTIVDCEPEQHSEPTHEHVPA